MCYANDGAALGVALALGEVPEAALSDDVVRRDWHLYSAVATTSPIGVSAAAGRTNTKKQSKPAIQAERNMATLSA